MKVPGANRDGQLTHTAPLCRLVPGLVAVSLLTGYYLVTQALPLSAYRSVTLCTKPPRGSTLYSPPLKPSGIKVSHIEEGLSSEAHLGYDPPPPPAPT